VAIRNGNFRWAEAPPVPPSVMESRIRSRIAAQLLAEWKKRAQKVTVPKRGAAVGEREDGSVCAARTLSDGPR